MLSGILHLAAHSFSIIATVFVFLIFPKHLTWTLICLWNIFVAFVLALLRSLVTILVYTRTFLCLYSQTNNCCAVWWQYLCTRAHFSAFTHEPTSPQPRRAHTHNFKQSFTDQERAIYVSIQQAASCRPRICRIASYIPGSPHSFLHPYPSWPVQRWAGSLQSSASSHLQ